MSEEIRILAIDYGTRRIGVAVSDPTGQIAQGLPTLSPRGLVHAASLVADLVRKYGAKTVVVGLPFGMHGGKTEATKQVEKFIQKLATLVSVPIVPWDERLTSVAAERAMHEMGGSPSRNRAKVDQVAAVLLLQGYLDSGKR
ncbi:MAG: Holliday junction resolvase RuvX [Calditrichaeota bacterium]|nr:Holliday junction resolvase RuvX [Calditrichota bacterium]